ncbi:MAG: (d)CMP kinase [Flavobacteriales bacterium]|nr:(d)CMP kinase [Flavobacteriales bacterium]
MRKNLTIAIDGHSACGKSTVAKLLAKELDYIYIDSGAMYRAIAFFALDRDLAEGRTVDREGLVEELEKIDIGYKRIGESVSLYMNGIEVEPLIRNMRVSQVVSPVSTIPEVREKLVEIQRAIGKEGGVVMDGRDIGTVVFPHADLKIFLTASIEERGRRRWAELQQRGVELSMDEVINNLLERDLIDSQREVSPLMQAEDALLIDNSNLDVQQTLNRILALVEKLGS